MKQLAAIVTTAAVAGIALVVIFGDAFDSTDIPSRTLELAVESADPKAADPVPKVGPRPGRTRQIYTQLPDLPPLPPASETTIEFPDGTSVDVMLKPYRPEPPPFTGWKKLIHVYDALIEEAESGDAAAARVLYRSLKNCEEAYTDKASYEEALEILHRDGIQIYPTGARSKNMIRGSLEMSHAEESMAESFEMCEGITAGHQENKIQWAEMAAHGGDYWSMAEMANERGFTPEGLYWYEQAWLNGFVGAADSLSIWYRKGAADPDNGQPDYFRSYAYLYLNYKVYADAMMQSTSPQAMNRVVSMENVIRNHGSFLSPEQQAEAESLAARLLQDNKNCCLGGWQAISR